ncbi:TRAP transporter substrate-binding protein [Calderihabitans maritimus]|uniref:TRAP dicarboxylate transporter subunit DctP n=1 Tax=Calderihabitans maritimus TaxID=1246530 RepID=A0A1Z5HRF2_9FIRM|nr:TRAP transporter substrate-binding protein [Calderihabitans maritimus]GAW91947.1 TRAP dicarboxylate transporter subunit DctP [Calderihabitans maritimus]
MKLKKVGMFVLILFAMAALIVGCGGNKVDNQSADNNDNKQTPPTKSVTLKIANYYAADHPVNQALRDKFKAVVEEKTGGKIKVEIYPNNQLGNEQEFIEGVQLGNIEMAMTGNMWENTVPQFRIMQLPYMFVNYEHANAVLNGPIGERIYKYLEPLNVKVLASFPNGFRVVSNNKRPITSIEDCKGIKLRVFQGETIIKEMKALGFDTVVMNFSEIFTALQQGVVDGQDNPLATSYYAGFYDVQKYVAITNHMYSPGYIVINMDVWNSLTEDEKALVEEAAQNTAEAILNAVRDQEEEIIKDITEKGVEVTYPDLKPFIERVKPIVDEYIEKYPETEDIIKDIQKLGEQYL